MNELETMLTKLGIEFETKPRQDGDITQADLDTINEEMWNFSKQNNYEKMEAWVNCKDKPLGK